MMPHVRIALDFDDTLMPTRVQIVNHLNRTHGTSISLESLDNYKFVDTWGLTESDFEAMFNQHESVFHQATPLPGVLETLRAWSDRTFHVITGRPDFWLASAQAWLKRHDITVAGIHSAPRTVDKARIAHAHGITLIIEDNPKVALDCAERGIDVLLLDTPYNRKCHHPRVSRVKDWFEIQRLSLNGYFSERTPHECEVRR